MGYKKFLNFFWVQRVTRLLGKSVHIDGLDIGMPLDIYGAEQGREKGVVDGFQGQGSDTAS